KHTPTELRQKANPQATVEYEENGQTKLVDTIVISTQPNQNIPATEIYEDILKHVIQAVVPENLLDEETKYFINPTGRFVIGGPQGDAGLSGRKIIVDTYGGYARQGRCAFRR